VGIVVLALASQFACSQRTITDAGAIVMKHEVSPNPPRVGPATLTIDLADISGAPISKAHVRLEADMAHAGMAPQVFSVRELDAGRYLAQGEFDMAGDWVILLNITLPNGAVEERQFDLKGVQSK
jgi:hypothetical protein